MSLALGSLRRLLSGRAASLPATIERRAFLVVAGLMSYFLVVPGTDAQAGLILSPDVRAVSAGEERSHSAFRGTTEANLHNPVAPDFCMRHDGGQGAGARPVNGSGGVFSSAALLFQSCVVQSPKRGFWFACEQALRLPPPPFFDRLRPPRQSNSLFSSAA
jgi:hypothetical protein